MFANAWAATDPITIAQGLDQPPPVSTQQADQTHTYFYSPANYRAPFDFVLAPDEMINVHFNAPLSVRWLKSDGQTDELDEQHVTLAVTNSGTVPLSVSKESSLEQLLLLEPVTSCFQLTAVVYRHQIVVDSIPDDEN
jgi:hypothetical protein